MAFLLDAKPGRRPRQGSSAATSGHRGAPRGGLAVCAIAAAAITTMAVRYVEGGVRAGKRDRSRRATRAAACAWMKRDRADLVLSRGASATRIMKATDQSGISSGVAGPARGLVAFVAAADRDRKTEEFAPRRVGAERHGRMRPGLGLLRVAIGDHMSLHGGLHASSWPNYRTAQCPG